MIDTPLMAPILTGRTEQRKGLGGFVGRADRGRGRKRARFRIGNTEFSRAGGTGRESMFSDESAGNPKDPGTGQPTGGGSGRLVIPGGRPQSDNFGRPTLLAAGRSPHAFEDPSGVRETHRLDLE